MKPVPLKFAAHYLPHKRLVSALLKYQFGVLGERTGMAFLIISDFSGLLQSFSYVCFRYQAYSKDADSVKLLIAELLLLLLVRTRCSIVVKG